MRELVVRTSSVHRVEDRTDGQEIEAIGVIGRDATEGAYVTYPFDNHGAAGTYKATSTDGT